MKDTLIERIKAAIKGNDNQEITGQILQDVLVSIVNGAFGAIPEVAQATGNSTSLVMSQKATSDELYKVDKILSFDGFVDEAEVQTVVNPYSGGKIYFVKSQNIFAYYREADGIYTAMWSFSGSTSTKYQSIVSGQGLVVNQSALFISGLDIYRWNGVNLETIISSNKILDSKGPGETEVMSQAGITRELTNIMPEFTDIVTDRIKPIQGSPLEPGDVIFSTDLNAFFYRVSSTYYTGWDSYLYYMDPATQAPIQNKLFLCNKKQYIFDEAGLVLLSSGESKQDKLVSGTNIKTINNQSILGSGNISIKGSGGSDIPKFVGIVETDIVTDGSPSDETNGEVFFNTATNTFILSVRGQGNFTNWSKITDYMTEYGGTPLTNKIFEYLSKDTSDTNNKKQYIFDGAGLVLLSSGESKQDKVEIIDLQSNQESYIIEPGKRYIIQQIGENVNITTIGLSAFNDWGYTKSYEIDFTTGENVGEIRIKHENNSIKWVKDLEILPNTRYLISIDATTSDDILIAMYVTINI